VITDRRSFLRGMVGLVGATVLVRPSGFLGLPTLWGDGITDDAPALNALLRGEPVHIVADTARVARQRQVFLNGGKFAIGSPIVVSNHALLYLERDITFNILSGQRVQPIFDLTQHSIVHMADAQVTAYLQCGLRVGGIHFTPDA
jgi:hypothetical protein